MFVVLRGQSRKFGKVLIKVDTFIAVWQDKRFSFLFLFAEREQLRTNCFTLQFLSSFAVKSLGGKKQEL